MSVLWDFMNYERFVTFIGRNDWLDMDDPSFRYFCFCFYSYFILIISLRLFW
jgi:hypothetical protein